MLSATPFLGNLMSMYEASTGKDWLYGTDLSTADRALAALGSLPGENTLGLGLRALKGMGALERVPLAEIGSAIGKNVLPAAEEAATSGVLKRLADSIIDTVYFRSPYQTLQTLARTERTDAYLQQWNNRSAPGQSATAFPLYDDPNNLFTMLAGKTYRFTEGMNDVFAKVASGQYRIGI
jgi:putative toxin of predicted polymorphic toxin system